MFTVSRKNWCFLIIVFLTFNMHHSKSEVDIEDPEEKTTKSEEKQNSSTPSSVNSRFFDLGGMINQMFPGFNQGGAFGSAGLNLPSNSQFYPRDGPIQNPGYNEQPQGNGPMYQNQGRLQQSPNQNQGFPQNGNVNQQGSINNFNQSPQNSNQGGFEQNPNALNGNPINGKGNQFGQYQNLGLNQRQPSQLNADQGFSPNQFTNQGAPQQWINPNPATNNGNNNQSPNGMDMNGTNNSQNQRMPNGNQQNMFDNGGNQNNLFNQGNPQSFTNVPINNQFFGNNPQIPNYRQNPEMQQGNNERQMNQFLPGNISPQGIGQNQGNNREQQGINQNNGLQGRQENFNNVGLPGGFPKENRGGQRNINDFIGQQNNGNIQQVFSTTEKSNNGPVLFPEGDTDDFNAASQRDTTRVAINGKSVSIPTSPMPDQLFYKEDDTKTPTQKQCIQNCQTSTEYNPVCGTDEVTYFNPGRLICARNCGIQVFEVRQGSCS